MTAIDTFAASTQTLETTCRNAEIAAPSDDDELEIIPRAIMLSAPGTVKFDMMGGQLGISLPLPGGVMLPIRPTKIYSTGTDSVTIILFW